MYADSFVSSSHSLDNEKNDWPFGATVYAVKLLRVAWFCQSSPSFHQDGERRNRIRKHVSRECVFAGDDEVGRSLTSQRRSIEDRHCFVSTGLPREQRICNRSGERPGKVSQETQINVSDRWLITIPNAGYLRMSISEGRIDR